LNKNFSNRYIF